jgi:hypothetical protein
MKSKLFKEQVMSASSLLANILDSHYKKHDGSLKSKEEWVFSKCITTALDSVINFLTDTEKFFKQKEVEAKRNSKRGGAIQDTSVSLQSVEPNSSQVTTSQFIPENELQPLSTKTQNLLSITNPVDSAYGLTENELGTDIDDVTNDNKSTTDIGSSVTTPIENDNSPKPMVKIYKTIDSQGEISFDVVIELFGDDIYGGYLGVSNGKSFLKILTSEQEVNEYVTENNSDLQEENNLITNFPEKIPVEEVSGEVSEKQPEEASGILSYIGLGGYNKSRSNRNKSRKVRKTLRQNKKSSKGTKKHKKIIKHKKSRSNI